MKKILNTGKQKGGALLVAMIFLGVLTMVGISVTFTSSSQMMVSYNHEEMSDSFWAAYEAALRLTEGHTAVGGHSAAVAIGGKDKDVLLMAPAQSLKEKTLDNFSGTLVSSFNDKISGDNPIFGTGENGLGKKITISIKQKAKGAICPRAQNGSSVTKIACDHFDVYSRYDRSADDEPPAGPGVQMGVYREMIHSNSTTHRDLDLSTGS